MKLPSHHVTSWVYLYQKVLFSTVKSANFVRTFSGNFVSFKGPRYTKKNVKQSEKSYETKKISIIIPILTAFLHKIDIYANNHTRQVASF